ncbi:MAG: YdcF family protein [Rhodomicrobium sp.]|nr:YdcF family protein [Rhodomicrobium sp.]
MKPALRKAQLGSKLIVKAIVRRTLSLCAFLTLALAGGFFVFAYCVSNMPPGMLRPADAIVALTGDEDRIAEAVRLLSQGKGGRLLISGVNKSTRTPEIMHLTTHRRNAFLFRCCIDIDKRSLNTEDNAAETNAWAQKRGFHSLIVVTSTYHMPRALIELRQSMPGMDLIAYPVKAPRLETQWWRDPRTSWVLCKEYLKFVTATARYAANRLARDPGKPEHRMRTINAGLD